MSRSDPDLLYVALVRTGDPKAFAARRARVADAIARHGGGALAAYRSDDRIALWGRPDRARLLSASDGQTLILGDVFNRSGTPLSRGELDRLTLPPALRPVSRASALLATAWGRYLALFMEPGERDSCAVLRDPLGEMPALCANLADACLIAPAWPLWLVKAAQTRIAPDEHMVAHLLAHPAVAASHSLLSGLTLMRSGVLEPVGGRDQAVPLWSPAAIVRAGDSLDRAAASDRLRSSVDLGCRARLPSTGTILIQLSGGLDSAIVLGTVARSMAAERIQAVNFATAYGEGDERSLAQAAAAHHGVDLSEREVDAETMDASRLAATATSAEPRLFGLDIHEEEMMIEIVHRHGARAILTGQGGDAVFYQMAYPDIAVDHRRQHGLASFLGPMPWIAAQRAGCSVWRIWSMMARDAIGSLASSPASAGFDPTLLGRRALDAIDPRLFRHPWLADTPDIAPAKRLHIETIANGQIFFSPTLRHREAPMIHPLLTQPVVEACLSIPVPDLAFDLRDRPLARDSFRDRLPAAILRRKGKGETSRYSNRAVVANLHFLRHYLLDGELVARGLVDRERLDAFLDEDVLATAVQARTPLYYAAVEAWLRGWGSG